MELIGNHYRQVLLNELERRQTGNPSYSLRAYSKHLGLNPTTMSLVLNGKRSLSEESIDKVCRSLQLDPHESRIFHAMVLSMDGRSPEIRLKYTRELNQLKTQLSGIKQNNYKDLSLTRFQVIAEWYHLAILECLHIKEYQSLKQDQAVTWLTIKLKLKKSQVLAALNRLKDLELIRIENGIARPTGGILSTGDSQSSAAIQKHHQQFLEKAQASLCHDAMDERDFSGIVVAVDERRIPEAKKMIQEFRKKLNHFLRGEHPSRVYRLGLNFFPLTEKGSSPEVSSNSKEIGYKKTQRDLNSKMNSDFKGKTNDSKETT